MQLARDRTFQTEREREKSQCKCPEAGALRVSWGTEKSVPPD